MLESFYSKELAVVFHFEDNGIVHGILTQNSTQGTRQEFDGIFEEGIKKRVCFIIDWDDISKAHHYRTAFSSIISKNTLRLNWLHITDGRSSDIGRALLIRDFLSPEIPGKLQGCRPYPLESVFTSQDN